MSDWWDIGYSWAGKSDEYTCCKIIWWWEEETVNWCWVIDKSTCHVFWWAYKVSLVTSKVVVSNKFCLFWNHFCYSFTVEMYSTTTAGNAGMELWFNASRRLSSELWQSIMLKISLKFSYYYFSLHICII